MLRMISAVVLVATTLLQAQTYTVCAGLNNTANTSVVYAVPAGTRVAVLFVATSALSVDQLQWYFPSVLTTTAVAPSGTVDIRLVDPVSGLPAATPIASATFQNNGGVIALAGTWAGGLFTSSVILYTGQSYFLTYTRSPIAGTANLGLEPTGPNATPFSLEVGGVWSPVQTTQQFKVRLRGTNCNGVPTAAWTSVGSGCSGSGSIAPTLTPMGLPQLGNVNLTLNIQGAPQGSPWALFWATSADPIGSILAGSCLLHLEISGFTAFLNAGINPLTSGLLDLNGSALIGLTVPNDPGLAGAAVAFQAAVAVPYGVAVAPGVNIVVTEAESALIGY